MADEPIEQEARVVDSDSGQGEQSRREERDERYRGATPPGYDWPTHGGYLGCLLGMVTGCLMAPLGYILVGFLGSLLAVWLGGFGVALAIFVTFALYLAVFFGLSRLGWVMGKRFLREYEQPMRPVWGEDDEEEYPVVVEADTAPQPDYVQPADQTTPAETPPADATPPQSEEAKSGDVS